MSTIFCIAQVCSKERELLAAYRGALDGGLKMICWVGTDGAERPESSEIVLLVGEAEYTF